ncbi:MAG: glucose-1-phosphate adenylyltransferase subunit GlgD [Clostridia bacterium]|nr:glucose-1-phosphate adenylyltransferase subunit GlgD [Clostridia bacterium]
MAAGIIFANLTNKNIPELTAVRTQASVPFGGRYRLIDFVLSSMVNAGITNVSVITSYNYQSLVDHLGSGKDWDLARRTGGLRLLTPNIASFSTRGTSRYDTRLDALYSISDALAKTKDEFLVVADADAIFNLDLSDMIAKHKESGADMTFAVKRMTLCGNQSEQYNLYSSDAEGNLTEVAAHPKNIEGEWDVSMNLWIASRTFLLSAIQDAAAHGYDSLTKGIVARYMDRADMKVYRYDGYFACPACLEDYFATSMQLTTDKEMRDDLFNAKNQPVITKVRNSPSTQYVAGSNVKNSMIADGCVIEGTVENCILFRGVRIGKGSVVKNCILFQDTMVGEGSSLNCVITDKNVSIRHGVTLSGHPSKPFYIDKNKMI